MKIYGDNIDHVDGEEEMFYDGLACPPMEAFDLDFVSRDHPPMNLAPNVFFRDQIFHDEKGDADIVGGHDQIPKQKQEHLVMGVGKGKDFMRFVQIFKPRNHGDLDYIKKCVRQELFGESFDDGGDDEEGYVEEAVEEQEKMKKVLDEFVIQQKFELTKRKSQDQFCRQRIKDDDDVVNGHAQTSKQQQQQQVMGVGKGKGYVEGGVVEEQGKMKKLSGEFVIQQKFDLTKKRRTHDQSSSYKQQRINEKEKFQLRKRKTHNHSYQQCVNEEEKFELRKRKTHHQLYQQCLNEEEKFELMSLKMQELYQRINESKIRKRMQVVEAPKSLVPMPVASKPKPKHKELLSKKKNLGGRKSYLQV